MDDVFIPGTYVRRIKGHRSTDEDYVMMALKSLLTEISKCMHWFQICIIVFKRPLLRNYRRIGLATKSIFSGSVHFSQSGEVQKSHPSRPNAALHYCSFFFFFFFFTVVSFAVVCGLGNLNVRSFLSFTT